MRRKIIAAGAIMLATVAGCGTAEVDRTDPTVQGEYVREARDASPLLARLDRTTLVDFGIATCEAFDEGATLGELALVVGTTVEDTEVAGALGVASAHAVGIMCPEHAEAFN